MRPVRRGYREGASAETYDDGMLGARSPNKSLSENPYEGFEYTDLDCYSTFFFAQNAEPSKTVNWLTIPEEARPQRKQLGG